MPSRRTFLEAGATTLVTLPLAGCLDQSGTGSPTPSPSQSPADSPTGTPGGTPGGTPDDTVDGTPDAGPPHGAPVRWTANLGSSVSHAPTLVDGTLYVGGGTNDRGQPPRQASYIRPTSSQNLYAFGTDGTERWRYAAEAGVLSSPVRTGGATYVVVGWNAGTHGVENRLVRVEGGEKRWSTGPIDRYLNVVGTDAGTVFSGTSDDALGTSGETLFAVDSSGQTTWRTEAGDARYGTVHDGSLYVDYADSLTTALSTADGGTRWRVPMGTPGEVGVFGDTLYLDAAEQNADGDYPLVAVSASDGTERWRYASAGGDEGPFVVTGAVESAETGLLYGTEYGGLLFALDPSDGSEVWRYEPGSETREAPSVVADTVYLPTTDGLHAVDAGTGAVRWTRSVRGHVWSADASDVGVVVRARFGEDEHGLVAFAPDGTQRWSFGWEGDLTLPTVDGLGAYVGTGSGYLVALGE